MKIFLAFVILGASAALADPNQWTTTPPGGRFQIVQSALVLRQTFKLDNGTGHIWELGTSPGGDPMWQPVQVDNLPQIDKPTPRFQIFCSGMAVRWCFMIDSWTGQTWILAVAGDGSQKFEVMADAQ